MYKIPTLREVYVLSTHKSSIMSLLIHAHSSGRPCAHQQAWVMKHKSQGDFLLTLTPNISAYRHVSNWSL